MDLWPVQPIRIPMKENGNPFFIIGCCARKWKLSTETILTQQTQRVVLQNNDFDQREI